MDKKTIGSLENNEYAVAVIAPEGRTETCLRQGYPPLW